MICSKGSCQFFILGGVGEMLKAVCWEVGGVDYSNAFHVDIDYCEDTCLDVSYTCEDIEDSYN